MISTRPQSILALAALPLSLALGLCLSGCSLQPGNGMTREQGDVIIAELREIRRTLADQPGAKVADKGSADMPEGRVEIADSDRQVLGSASAKVTLVEFTDYQCPFCKRFHDRSWPELKVKYVDTGKVRYIVRDMPLSFHVAAMPAAIAARCAGEQGKFWQVHEALFNAQETLSPAMIKTTAAGFGVDAPAFDKCQNDARIQASIDADIAEAERIGVTGTPGFVLAEKRGSKLDGVLILGSQPTAVFSSRIDALLSAPPAP